MDKRQARLKQLNTSIENQILVLDGAMGTMIQNYGLTEEDFRGTRFADHNHELKGNGEVLSLSQPHVIKEIHASFLEAGADILETNTFSATAVAQADYGLEHLVEELNFESAKLAREACEEAEAKDAGRTCYVAGILGPTNRTASISPDVNDPALRNVSFDELRETYKIATLALVRGGADILMVETIFDTLNAKGRSLRYRRGHLMNWGSACRS